MCIRDSLTPKSVNLEPIYDEFESKVNPFNNSFPIVIIDAFINISKRVEQLSQHINQR